jgi:hypothetical protein
MASMHREKNNPLLLPTATEIASLFDIYLEYAYEGNIPPAVSAKLTLPGIDAEVADWLMSDRTERTPPNVPIEEVRAFAVRLGNVVYPHMKLRFSRPPADDVLIASVDSHDAMLKAPEGSPDFAALEELKAFNAELGRKINSAWGEAKLLTEHEYLRRKIRQAKDS